MTDPSDLGGAVPFHRLFVPFGADAREELDWFRRDVDALRCSRYAKGLDQLGGSPTLEILKRNADGGGAGIIKTRTVWPEVRHAVFMLLRKLRTEGEPASVVRVANLLSQSASRRATIESERMVFRMRTLKRRLRDAESGQAAVGFVVCDERGKREYATTSAVLDLVQNGHGFHNDRRKRRDLDAIFESLIEPAVDRGLRAVTETALELELLVAMILDAPELIAR